MWYLEDRDDESNNPAGIYLFKINIKTLEQGVKYIQS